MQPRPNDVTAAQHATPQQTHDNKLAEQRKTLREKMSAQQYHQYVIEMNNKINDGYRKLHLNRRIANFEFYSDDQALNQEGNGVKIKSQKNNHFDQLGRWNIRHNNKLTDYWFKLSKDAAGQLIVESLPPATTKNFFQNINDRMDFLLTQAGATSLTLTHTSNEPAVMKAFFKGKNSLFQQMLTAALNKGVPVYAEELLEKAQRMGAHVLDEKTAQKFRKQIQENNAKYNANSAAKNESNDTPLANLTADEPITPTVVNQPTPAPLSHLTASPESKEEAEEAYVSRPRF